MRKVMIGLISGLALLASSPATGQGLCGPHEEIVKKLAQGYKEARAGWGLAGNNGLVELYVSEAGGWSILITRPNGLTCLVAAGRNWEIVEPDFVATAEDFS
jgi:hypothetical protein